MTHEEQKARVRGLMEKLRSLGTVRDALVREAEGPGIKTDAEAEGFRLVLRYYTRQIAAIDNQIKELSA